MYRDATSETRARMEMLKRHLMRAADMHLTVRKVYPGPGETFPPVVEFTMCLNDDQEFHVRIQEGACPEGEQRPTLKPAPADETCTPQLVDGQYVGCGRCPACEDQADTEDQAEEEYR